VRRADGEGLGPVFIGEADSHPAAAAADAHHLPQSRIGEGSTETTDAPGAWGEAPQVRTQPSSHSSRLCGENIIKSCLSRFF
jgi:hypothetical protein